MPQEQNACSYGKEQSQKEERTYLVHSLQVSPEASVCLFYLGCLGALGPRIKHWPLVPGKEGTLIHLRLSIPLEQQTKN